MEPRKPLSRTPDGDLRDVAIAAVKGGSTGREIKIPHPAEPFIKS